MLKSWVFPLVFKVLDVYLQNPLGVQVRIVFLAGRVQGFGFRVSGSGFRVQAFGFRLSGGSSFFRPALNVLNNSCNSISRVCNGEPSPFWKYPFSPKPQILPCFGWGAWGFGACRLKGLQCIC